MASIPPSAIHQQANMDFTHRMFSLRYVREVIHITNVAVCIYSKLTHMIHLNGSLQRH